MKRSDGNVVRHILNENQIQVDRMDMKGGEAFVRAKLQSKGIEDEMDHEIDARLNRKIRMLERKWKGQKLIRPRVSIFV